MSERDYYPSYYDPGYETSGSSGAGSLDFAAFGRAARTVAGEVGSWVGTAARDVVSWTGTAATTAGPGALGAAGGTLLSFAGSMLAAKQAKKAAAYNAAVLERNAQAAAAAMETEAAQHARNASLVLQNIFLVRQSQQEQEHQQRQQQAYVASQTRAIVGASGLMMRGSPLAVYEAQLRAQSERQILAGRYAADLQERAIRDQATMETYAADLARFGAGERLRVGGLQGALARYGGSQQALGQRVAGLGELGSGTARTLAAYEQRQARRGPTATATALADTSFE